MATIKGPSMISHDPTRMRLEPTRTRVSPARGLKPFDHQVAGQSVILHYDETTICKCLIHREYNFYQTMPKCLQPFVPQFRGVIELYIPDASSHDCPSECRCTRLHHHHSSPQGTALGWLQNESPAPYEVEEGIRLDPSHMRVLRKTSRGGDGGFYYFMLLEDLIARYSHPCILDLKMGVRQHGDDAPAEKVAYQVNKCKTTTSASLGVRLCGMKRYNVLTGDYETQDKMFGRQLSDDELKSQLVGFLFSGQDLRSDLVEPILLQLTNLKNVVEQLEGYRFYSCSLLIIYNGRVEDVEEQHEELPTLDERNLSRSPVESQLEKDIDMENDGDSEGSGSEDLERATPNMENINTSPMCHCSSSLPIQSRCHTGDTQQLCTVENQCKCHSSSFLQRHDTSNASGSKSRSKHSHNSVDVRIVDFAHATYDGFIGDTVRHCGPDHGFLLGVNTLLEVFRDLKDRDS